MLPLTLADHLSRYLLSCRGQRSTAHAPARGSLPDLWAAAVDPDRRRLALLVASLSAAPVGREYNRERPHEALGQIPPTELYTRSARPYPERVLQVSYPSYFEVRRVKANGVIR